MKKILDWLLLPYKKIKAWFVLRKKLKELKENKHRKPTLYP